MPPIWHRARLAMSATSTSAWSSSIAPTVARVPAPGGRPYLARERCCGSGVHARVRHRAEVDHQHVDAGSAPVLARLERSRTACRSLGDAVPAHRIGPCTQWILISVPPEPTVPRPPRRRQHRRAIGPTGLRASTVELIDVARDVVATARSAIWPNSGCVPTEQTDEHPRRARHAGGRQRDRAARARRRRRADDCAVSRVSPDVDRVVALDFRARGGGFRVLAPDMRGYGRSSARRRLLRTTPTRSPTISPGSSTTWGARHDLRRPRPRRLDGLAPRPRPPDRVRAVIALSVPFSPRPPLAPTQGLRAVLGADHYLLFFQAPGVADDALHLDVRRTLLTEGNWTRAWSQSDSRRSVRCGCPKPSSTRRSPSSPARASRAGRDYRNLDRNWELSARFADDLVEQPALFISGENDIVRSIMPADAMLPWVPDLETATVASAGHFVHQEQPGEVNGLLLRFVRWQERQRDRCRGGHGNGHRVAASAGAAPRPGRRVLSPGQLRSLRLG